MKPLVLVGTGHISEILTHYFNRCATIVAYAMDDAPKVFLGKPVVPFKNVENFYPPSDFDMFIAVGYKKLNYLRAHYYNKAKDKGYTLVNYVDPAAVVNPTVKMGDNVFIFELNNIQYDVTLGSDVLLWSANHIGHSAVIKDHVYIASHVVISGFCQIGEYTFVGVNAAFADSISIGRDCLIGMGANVVKSVPDRKIIVPSKSSILEFEQLSLQMKEMYWPGVNL